jgi:hypothetical protein
MTLADSLVGAVVSHPAVRKIELVGSRAEGRAAELSDWDFRVETDDFERVAESLPALVSELDPLAQQWDRLSPEWCYMLILRGPTKVDLIFPQHQHADEPPWEPSRDNLADLDAHFWDWMLWLHAKEVHKKRDLVATELEKLAQHLLNPLGSPGVPSSIAEAVARYRAARDRAEDELGVRAPRELEDAVAPHLTRR